MYVRIVCLTTFADITFATFATPHLPPSTDTSNSPTGRSRPTAPSRTFRPCANANLCESHNQHASDLSRRLCFHISRDFRRDKSHGQCAYVPVHCIIVRVYVVRTVHVRRRRGSDEAAKRRSRTYVPAVCRCQTRPVCSNKSPPSNKPTLKMNRRLVL